MSDKKYYMAGKYWQSRSVYIKLKKGENKKKQEARELMAQELSDKEQKYKDDEKARIIKEAQEKETISDDGLRPFITPAGIKTYIPLLFCTCDNQRGPAGGVCGNCGNAIKTK